MLEAEVLGLHIQQLNMRIEVIRMRITKLIDRVKYYGDAVKIEDLESLRDEMTQVMRELV